MPGRHIKSDTQAITAWVQLLFKDQIVYRFPDSRFPIPFRVCKTCN
ncbi:MAG: hypothetical protein F6K37_34455 [Moorea sp. SIO4E2]|nr:hypothetical protein [Moorena sp. SIO4E2]NEQ10839.1 hypothetical protein [Moorena sp. SIO4E2]